MLSFRFVGVQNDQIEKKLPVQLSPSSSYPGLQVQLYDPLVFLQSALKLQLWVPLSHSSMSEIIFINNRNLVRILCV